MVEINKEFPLKETNFIHKEFKKKQIVIGNTNYSGMDHYKFWTKILNGKDTKNATYTITLDGSIYEHYDPKYYSTFITKSKTNKHMITIVLENEGWLNMEFNNNKLVNWSGDIYNREQDVINVKWRNKDTWAPYSEEQLESLVWLCKKLCNEFDIPMTVENHNTKIKGIENKSGIFYRSNYGVNYLDVSPAFDIEKFKEKLEQ